MLGITIYASSISFWNVKSNKICLIIFSFCMQFLHDDGALLIFNH